MKPNLILVQTAHHDNATDVESLCERLASLGYVYLIRPGSAFRDDSPAGVRFLGNPLDGLPRFGKVDTVISVGDTATTRHLETFYEGAQITEWNPSAGKELPACLAEVLSTKVIPGNFSTARERRFSRAM